MIFKKDFRLVEYEPDEKRKKAPFISSMIREEIMSQSMDLEETKQRIEGLEKANGETDSNIVEALDKMRSKVENLEYEK